MMTKNKYLILLDKGLRKMPESERRNAIQYYIEYFNEAGEENEQSVINELGSPKELASVILSEFAVKTINTKEKSSFKEKLKLPKVKWTIIGIATLPISVPLACFFDFRVSVAYCRNFSRYCLCICCRHSA